MEADLQEKVNETKRVLEFQYENEKANMEKEHKKEIEKIEMRFKDLIKKLENEVAAFKNIELNKSELESVIESYKAEVKVKIPLKLFIC